MSIKKTIIKGCAQLQHLPVIGEIFKPKPKVAVIRLSGIIAEQQSRKPTISFAKYRDLIKDAFDAHNLKEVVLIINSPGGSPAQSELIGNYIRQQSEEKEIPVTAFIEDVAASGGYWLACAADKIYTAETSIIGSIGVISASFGLQDLIERYGVERRIHTSGKDKSFLDPFVPEKPGDVKRLKEIQAELHESFKDWVRMRRGEALTAADKDVFEGQFWTAPTARGLGIIDDIGDYERVMKDKHGEEIKFLDFQPDRGFFASLIDAKSPMAGLAADDLIDAVEFRAIWGRYGL